MYEYYDNNLQTNILVSSVLTPITNYEYESKLEEDKRNIFVLKEDYITIAIDDLKEIMECEKGSTQYMSKTLKRGDNIRLYS